MSEQVEVSQPKFESLMNKKQSMEFCIPVFGPSRTLLM